MKKVLVTGGAGYIGSVLLPKLVTNGYSVRVVDRLFWGVDPIAELLSEIELIEGDVRSLPPGIFSEVFAVIHLAGLSNDPTAEFAPKANWEMNTVATATLADDCATRGIQRVTFGSSCSVYDSLPGDVVYDEDASLTPRGAYATSKAAAENELRTRTSRSFQPTILRQGTVYGASPRMRYDLVVNTFVRDAVRSGALELHGGGLMHRPLVEVNDVAEAHISCIEAPLQLVGGKTFNVVQHNYVIREVAATVQKHLHGFGIDVRLRDAPLPPIVREYQCANDRLTRATGFSPQRSLELGISELLHVARTSASDFDNPRYYNIEWLTPRREEIESPTPLSKAAAKAVSEPEDSKPAPTSLGTTRNA